MPRAQFTTDIPFGNLEKTLAGYEADLTSQGGSFELIPDFQRGHVWTDEQRTAFVEAVIRGTTSAKVLFNCPGWSRDLVPSGDIQPYQMCCIDGLQRLTTLRRFMAGEIAIFGDLRAEDLRGSPFDPFRMKYCIHMGVYEFSSRADLLQFFLDLNNGGTFHPTDELERVRGLLAATQGERHGDYPRP